MRRDDHSSRGVLSNVCVVVCDDETSIIRRSWHTGAVVPCLGTLGAVVPCLGTLGAIVPRIGTLGAVVPCLGTLGAVASC
jgi:hypothetical protein